MKQTCVRFVYMTSFLLFVFSGGFAGWEEGGKRTSSGQWEQSSEITDAPFPGKKSEIISGLATDCSDSSVSSMSDSSKNFISTGVTILKTPTVWGSSHDTIVLNTLMYDQQNIESIEFFSNENQHTFVRSSLENPYSFGASLWLIVPSVVTTLFLFLYTDFIYLENPKSQEETALLLCGYAGCATSISFGVKKMKNHFRWKRHCKE